MRCITGAFFVVKAGIPSLLLVPSKEGSMLSGVQCYPPTSLSAVTEIYGVERINWQEGKWGGGGGGGEGRGGIVLLVNQL